MNLSTGFGRFFKQNESRINAGGIAFLEYKSDTNERTKMPFYYNFSLSVVIMNSAPSVTSCRDRFLNLLFGSFRKET